MSITILVLPFDNEPMPISVIAPLIVIDLQFSDFIKLIKPAPFVYMTSLILLLIGILVGMFGSWRASYQITS